MRWTGIERAQAVRFARRLLPERSNYLSFGESTAVPGDCIFCSMMRDRSLVPYSIAESERAFAFLEKYPIRRGHSLVIPKTHATDLFDVSPEDLHAVIDLAREVARRLRQRLGASGENLLWASGPGSEQSVFHLHVHVVPRLPSDDLRWNDWWQTKLLSVTLPELVSLAATLRD